MTGIRGARTSRKFVLIVKALTGTRRGSMIKIKGNEWYLCTCGSRYQWVRKANKEELKAIEKEVNGI
jgi:hypothetical protein